MTERLQPTLAELLANVPPITDPISALEALAASGAEVLETVDRLVARAEADGDEFEASRLRRSRARLAALRSRTERAALQARSKEDDDRRAHFATVARAALRDLEKNGFTEPSD